MENKKSGKKICKECGIEKLENQYYLTPNGIKLEICKDCFRNEFYNSKDLFQVFKKYDIPYFYDIWDKVYYNIGEYMKQINSLPQYKYKTWKDSVLHKEEDDDSENTIGFYDEIIKNLKEEAKKLNQKLLIATNKDDMQLYISAIKSLRETLDLIHKYDWQLMYSTYSTTVDDKEERHIAVWEQNHDMQIRNHRVWKIIE